MRLIDADALLDKTVKKNGVWKSITNSEGKNLEEIVSEIPTEVIRCKDCKWFNQIGCAIQIVDETDRPTEDDFCSFAERVKKGDEWDRVTMIDVNGNSHKVTFKKKIEDMGDYPDTIPNQFDNMTGSMNL